MSGLTEVGGRSAPHHLQVKAALALLYHILGSPNPFAQRVAPKFAPEKTELRYHTSSQLGRPLRELREPACLKSGSYPLVPFDPELSSPPAIPTLSCGLDVTLFYEHQ